MAKKQGAIGVQFPRPPYTAPKPRSCILSGSEKGVFWKRGLFRKSSFPELLENSENVEIPDNPQTVENTGESDHLLEILENLEIVEIQEIPPATGPVLYRSLLPVPILKSEKCQSGIPEDLPQKSIRLSKSRKMSRKCGLVISIDFWAVQKGILRTLKCTLGVSGLWKRSERSQLFAFHTKPSFGSS